MSEEKKQTMSEEKKEHTAEELEAYREKMLKFYTDEIPLLSKRKEYEVLQADVEEARARRITMTMRISSMLAPAPVDPKSKKDNTLIPE